MELGAMAKAFHPHGRTREDCVDAQGMYAIHTFIILKESSRKLKSKIQIKAERKAKEKVEKTFLSYEAIHFCLFSA